MIDEDITTKHRSYGMVSISRVTGSERTLFGSSIPHHATIMLRIHRASNKRNLSTNWYHPEKNLIEIEMSQAQFCEAITSMNTIGVPVTLRHVGGKRMANPPFESKRQVFENEFKSQVEKITELAATLQDKANEILNRKGSVKKAEKEELQNIMHKFVMNLRSNVPFIQKRFNESMDKTVFEAKSEFDSFVTAMVNRLGIKGLKNKTELIKLETDND